MIDKADFRIPRKRRMTEEFSNIFAHANAVRNLGDAAEIHFNPAGSIFRPSKYYDMQGDFREYDLPVMLHYGCKMTKTRDHKVEILGTGDRPYSEIKQILGRMFQGDPEELELLRVDLTADIADVPVRWFKEKTYVAGKQTTREIGTVAPIPYMAIRQGKAETLYAGVKPNQMRIYDKVGEQLMQYKRYVRQQVKEAKMRMMDDYVVEIPLIPTFKERHGFTEDEVVTRVERQVHGRDLEKLRLTNLRSLTVADALEPFKALRFFTEDPDDNLSLPQWGWRDWHAGMNMRRMSEGMGMGDFRKMMQAELGTNFYREWSKFAPFLRGKSRVIGITSAKLQNEYMRSTILQMSA